MFILKKKITVNHNSLKSLTHIFCYLLKTSSFHSLSAHLATTVPDSYIVLSKVKDLRSRERYFTCNLAWVSSKLWLLLWLLSDFLLEFSTPSTLFAADLIMNF